MTAKPWMRWHVDRWRKSPRVLAMSLAAQGAYRNLLDAAWDNGGKLPNVPGILWRHALAQGPADFETVAAEVLPMFKVSECGQFLTNETLSAEWDHSEERMEIIRAERSEAGKKGAQARWQNGKPIAKPKQADDNECQILDLDKDSKGKEESKPCASAAAEGAGSDVPPKQSEFRHKPTELHIKALHQERFNIACQWDGSEGRALSEVLGSNKSWTQEQIFLMVGNVFKSKKNYGRPREWLRSLSKWADGPKDEFGNNIGSVTGRGNGQKDKCSEITRETTAALLDRRRARRVASSEIGDPAECVPKSAVN